MDLEEFHKIKYLEAVEQENWERAEHHDRKYTKIVTSREAALLGKVLFWILVVTILSPFINWWIWR